MSFTSIPLRQHEKIKAHATQLADMIRAGKLGGNEEQAARIVKRLLLEITSHLKVEDEKVYPRLQHHKDPKVRVLGSRYQREMGSMAPAVVTWGDRWSRAAIESKPDVFVDETRELFKALKARIDREEAELYPVLAEIG